MSKLEAGHLAQRNSGSLTAAQQPDRVAIAALLFGFFIFFFMFIVLETIGVPLCQQQLGKEVSNFSRNISLWSFTYLCIPRLGGGQGCVGSRSPDVRGRGERLS